MCGSAHRRGSYGHNKNTTTDKKKQHIKGNSKKARLPPRGGSAQTHASAGIEHTSAQRRARGRQMKGKGIAASRLPQLQRASTVYCALPGRRRARLARRDESPRRHWRTADKWRGKGCARRGLATGVTPAKPPPTWAWRALDYKRTAREHEGAGLVCGYMQRQRGSTRITSHRSGRGARGPASARVRALSWTGRPEPAGARRR